MTRVHRLFELLQTLRRHRQPVSGAELARDTGISLRTLYRDIATLQEMGAEIEGEAGVGYVLRPGFLLPPLMFADQEIEALALGLKWVGERTDAGLADAARNAMVKLAAVLPDERRARLEDDIMVIGPVAAPQQRVDLAILRRALRQERKLALDYTDEKGARTERIVWPVTLGFFETTRVLVGWCELRQDFRHFRTDRILTAELLPERPPRARRSLLRQWRGSLLTKTDRMPG